MALPKAVQQQEDEADRMLAEIDEAKTSQEPGAPAPVSTTPEPTPTGGETPTELEETVRRLEHSYAVLKGKYDAEVPRLSEALRSASEENRTLREEVDLANQAVIAEEVFEEDPDAAKRYLSEQELEEVDESAIEFQARIGRGVAEDVTQAHVEPMQARIAELESHINRLETVQHSAKKSQFWEKVDALAPGAMGANSTEDPEWVDFLGTTDENTGMKYRDIGLAAIKRGDTKTVARLFKKCKGEVAPPGGPTKEELISHQTSPRTSRSGATATATASMPQPVKESEIRETYRLAALGKISPEELAVREAEFDRAASEGLVIFRQ